MAGHGEGARHVGSAPVGELARATGVEWLREARHGWIGTTLRDNRPDAVPIRGLGRTVVVSFDELRDGHRTESQGKSVCKSARLESVTETVIVPSSRRRRSTPTPNTDGR